MNPSIDQTCFYSNNNTTQSITWGTNTGLVSGYPVAPQEQQQRNVLYECGTDPNKISTLDAVYNSPNPNYQFTADGYCLKDLTAGYNSICFHDDGSAA